MTRVPYQEPHGVIKLFEVAEDGTGAPPEPWQRVGDDQLPPKIDPEKREKADLATAIEALGGKADQRRSIDALRAQLESLEKAAEEPEGELET